VAALNVDLEKVSMLVDTITEITGPVVQDGVADLAALVAENEGNEYMEAYRPGCQKMQVEYNDKFVKVCVALITELAKFEEFDALTKKLVQTFTEVKSIAAEFKANEVALPNV